MLTGRRLARGWLGGRGFPNALNTGCRLPSGSLSTVGSGGGKISSGTNWSYNSVTQAVVASGGPASFENLIVPCNISIHDSASGTTISNCIIATSGASGDCVTLKAVSGPVTGVTITDSTISGLDAGSGRVSICVNDSEGSATGITILRCNMHWCRIGANYQNGLIQDCYIHDMGYQFGDHTECLYIFNPQSASSMIVRHNTLLNQLSETTACYVTGGSSADWNVGGVTIDGNLMAGGDYALYAGSDFGHTAPNVIVTNNRFSQAFYPAGGDFGTHTAYGGGTGSVWSGNVIHDTGAAVAA